MSPSRNPFSDEDDGDNESRPGSTNPFDENDNNNNNNPHYSEDDYKYMRVPILTAAATANTTTNNIVLCGRDIGLTSEQLSTIFLLSIDYLLSASYYSLFAPFLPGEALKKDVSQTQVGIIFGVFELVLIILIPFFGKYVT